MQPNHSYSLLQIWVLSQFTNSELHSYACNREWLQLNTIIMSSHISERYVCYTDANLIPQCCIKLLHVHKIISIKTHTSDFSENCRCEMASGAIHLSGNLLVFLVDWYISSASLERPKSVTLSNLLQLTSTFLQAKSRWMMLMLDRYSWEWVEDNISPGTGRRVFKCLLPFQKQSDMQRMWDPH